MLRCRVAIELIKEHPVKVVIASLCTLLSVGLSIWNSYVPLSISGWNEKEILRIKVTNPEDFTFAVFGDNRGNHSFFDPLLRDISQNGEIAFAIGLGDHVNGGQNGKYRRFFKQLHEGLKIPFLATIGNRDLYGGSGNYRDIFGPTYYSFQVGQAYFLVLDAATEMDFDKAERQWLEEELQKSQAAQVRIVFMHVPPFDVRGGEFHKVPKYGKDLLDLFRRNNVTHLFASHIHGYFTGVSEGIPYTITGGGGARLQGNDPEHFFHHYLKVHVNNGNVDTSVSRVDSGNVMKSLYGDIKDFLLE
jgi:hypothetical protein